MTAPPLKWKSADGMYAVHVTKRALNSMVRLAGQHAPREVGTSLVGSYSDDGHAAVVRGLAPLTQDSQGSRFSFLRGVRGIRSFFEQVFRRFRGHRHYVGEWHSHPQASPIASDVDDRNQNAIAHDGNVGCPECVLVILGGDIADAPTLGVYVYSRSRGRVDLVPVENA
jgi:integrative and conjugative element protein (TIGR02256 family)